MVGTLPDEPALALGPAERADVQRSASESLARQSVAGVYGHWVLASVVLWTATVARHHPAGALVAATWVALVGAGRVAVAKSFART